MPGTICQYSQIPVSQTIPSGPLPHQSAPSFSFLSWQFSDLFIGLTVSSLSPRNLQILFYFLIIIIISLLASFSNQYYPGVFDLGLSDSKSPDVSRTFPNILANQI